MADDQSTIHGRRKPGRRRHGPLTVQNPGNSDEDESYERSMSHTARNHRPIPNSPYSEHSSLPSTSYTPKSSMPTNPVHVDQQLAYTEVNNPSNPSLSSPSGSSSPAVESTPPPSTPGQSLPPPSSAGDGSTLSGKSCYTATEDKGDARQHDSTPRMMAAEITKKAHLFGHSKSPSQTTSPIAAASTPHSVATTRNNVREPINRKVLVTTDCDVYANLDITGATNGAMIREMMFSKLQIPDDQQSDFSIYRNEIGSFAIGGALSDDYLMEVCREEADSRGTLKFFLQHSSAAVHLPHHRPRAANHVPPVLPSPGNFQSPSITPKSTKSNHETISSASEKIVAEVVTNGYEGSVSDDLEPHDFERHRNTIRPSPSQVPPPPFYGTAIPSSPLDQRRRRDPSPPNSRSTLSLARPLDTNPLQSSGGLISNDHGRLEGTTPTMQQSFSPSGGFNLDETNPVSFSNQRMHSHSASDAIMDRGRERMQGLAGRQVPSEREQRLNERSRQGVPKHKGNTTDYPEGTVKRTEEPWVLVPSSDRSATSSAHRIGTQRAATHTPSASHSGTYSSESTNRYAIGTPSRPPATSSNHQAIPLYWINMFAPGQGSSRSSNKGKLYHAKSMDNLRPINPPNAGSSASQQRKANQNPLTRPSVNGLREAANLSAGSFMNIDLPRMSMPKSYEHSRSAFSPTGYSPSRPLPVASSQSQGEFVSQFRPLPVQGQPSAPNTSTYLNATSNQNSWRQSPEDRHPRPHSALDDIGQSPAPLRNVRPLPSTGGRPTWTEGESPLDMDDSRTNRLAATHHPYARALPLNQPISKSGGDMNMGSSDSAELDSQAENIHSSPHIAQNPDGSRRTPVDERDLAAQTQAGLDIPKSFVCVQDSPVYDGDNEAAVQTLKSDWITPYINGNSLSDGTLKPILKSGRDKPLPNPNIPAASYVTKELSTPTFYTSAGGTVLDDRGGFDSGGDDYDDDGSGSLWKTPLKPRVEKALEAKRPALVVDTESNRQSPSQPYRTPYYGQNFPGIPPNMPPPNFPLPPPPSAHGDRSRVHKGKTIDKPMKGDKSNRDSQFIKAGSVTWAFRPPAEEMYDNLELFFPEHDLDKPVIDFPAGGSSPTAAEPAIPAFQGSSAGKERKTRHKKSIRIVAAEHKRKIDYNNLIDSAKTSVMRKRSTKLWGSKVEEVTTSQIPNIPVVPESPTAANPKPIFKWVRGELIGKGSYGRVYVALNVTTGEMIAVKQVELRNGLVDEEDSRQHLSVVEALKSESETLKDLDHPNIVQYLGFEQTPDFLSIFLEYVEGGSVAGCLRRHGKFEDAVARSFTGQILAGLEYLHSAGVIHRDLKADNILVERSGICKISDFGISKRTADINEAGIHTSLKGTIFWMAPEVVTSSRAGEKNGYNGKVDIWSLGCVVLEMWAGHRPWQDTEMVTVLIELATKQAQPPVPPGVILSPEADDFRLKCFAFKPDERPSASELRQHRYLVLPQGWTFPGFK